MNLEQLLEQIRLFFPDAQLANYKIRIPNLVDAKDEIKAWVTLFAKNNKMLITRDEDGSWLLYFEAEDINQPEPVNTRKREDQIEKFSEQTAAADAFSDLRDLRALFIESKYLIDDFLREEDSKKKGNILKDLHEIIKKKIPEKYRHWHSGKDWNF